MSVSEAARELQERYGVSVLPHELSNLFYRRELDTERCQVVAGRRMIPVGYLAHIANVVCDKDNKIRESAHVGDDND